MVWPALVKLIVTSGLGLSSWLGIHHGCLKHKFEGMLRGWKGEVEYKKASCQSCLDNGMDFCISSNKCIKRATFHCKGPYDHITGDKEFSLHGNPEGVVHSMTCPAEKDEVAKKDCYFDKECHDKVDWAAIKKIKGGFFGRLKYFREQDNEQGVQDMVKKVHVMFAKAGMPEDRIDYILEKWVKTVFPDGVEKKDKKGDVDKKDCYFDKECHDKVDWTVIGSIKNGFFARLKYFKQKNDKSGVQKMLKNVHAKFKEAGMPEDRIDYILEKWVKNVFPEALDDEDKSKDCYFDKECHAKVDWDKITKIKMGFFARLKMLKAKNNAAPVKDMMTKVHQMFLDAGMPEDRIDYILTKWVKFVYPEALGGDSPKPKPKWDMCAVAKKRCMKDGEKVLEGRCMWLWKKCGHQLGMYSSDGFKPKPKFDMCTVIQLYIKDGEKRCMKNGEELMPRKCAWVWKKCGREAGVLV